MAPVLFLALGCAPVDSSTATGGAFDPTIGPVMRSGLALRAAIPVALAADTVSILTMEVVDNAFLVLLPGAMEATLTSALFWWSLAAALAIAFVVTVPVNHWMIGRGKGHAVVHAMHGHDHHMQH